MVNIEHQNAPSVVPKAEWIKIDHASSNVGYATEIDPRVQDFFEVVVDPTDGNNVWLSPKAEVVVLGKLVEDDDKVVYLLEVPDGHDTRLLYEYRPGTGFGLGDGYYAVTVASDPQLVFGLFAE